MFTAIVFQPEDGYAILSEFDNVGAYTSPSYINNYIPVMRIYLNKT